MRQAVEPLRDAAWGQGFPVFAGEGEPRLGHPAPHCAARLLGLSVRPQDRDRGRVQSYGPLVLLARRPSQST